MFIEPQGRVVILDFGLVADLGVTGAHRQSHAAGTPLYMAPEQAAGHTVTCASDWYSVGVMLYEALTGSRPFEGSADELLRQKRDGELPLPPLLRPGVPQALADLCRDLLAPDPRDRPEGAEIEARLAGGADTAAVPADGGAATSPPPAAPPSLFVGRAGELDTLHRALAAVRGRQSISVVVEGESGVGKTTLVRRFVEQVAAADPSVVCFAGRCFEHESLPYKAIDGVMDQARVHIESLPKAARPRLTRERFLTVAQAFPALRQLVIEAADAGDAVGPGSEPGGDPLRLRATLFDGLRALFDQIARQATTLIVIDDLHWADADSLALIGALMQPPNAPPLLLVAAQRPVAGGDDMALAGDVRRVRLENLSRPESLELVGELFARAPSPKLLLRRASDVAEEARGHPFFIREIVRHILDSAGAPAQESVLLDEAIWRRIQVMDAPARRLIALAAVAGIPIAQRTIIDAFTRYLPIDADGAGDAGAAGAPTHATALASSQIALLRDACLVRTGGPGLDAAIEPYHDRVRESVVGRLDPAIRARLHLALAEALEHSGTADAETRAVHWREAGEPGRAAGLAEQAADEASTALAFERAARLYRMTMDLERPARERRRALLAKMAGALAQANRARAAAAAYHDAAEEATGMDAVSLRRLAAEQLLRAGDVEAGMAAMREVLETLGVRNPEGYAANMASLLWSRFRLRVRGFDYVEREAGAGGPLARARIETLQAAANGLMLFDSVRSAALQSRSTLMALRVGTPMEMLKAFGIEAILAAGRGQAARRRVQRLLGSATDLAQRIGRADAAGWEALCRGVSSFFLGDFRDGDRQCALAEGIFADRGGARWELGNARAYGVWSAMMCGRFGHMQEKVRQHIAEAESRGDLYAATTQMTGFSNTAWLAVDDVAEARRMLALAERRWPGERFDIIRYLNMVAAVHIDLYDGRGLEAYRRVQRDWRPLRWGLAFTSQITRVGMRFLRGLSALVAFEETRDRRLLADARRCARAMVAERASWSDIFVALLEAGLAVRATDDRSAAIRHLRHAEAKAEATGMALHGAVARYRRGSLEGGERGRQLETEAMDLMARQEIRNPAAMLAMLSPPV